MKPSDHPFPPLLSEKKIVEFFQAQVVKASEVSAPFFMLDAQGTRYQLQIGGAEITCKEDEQNPDVIKVIMHVPLEVVDLKNFSFGSTSGLN